MTRLLLFLTPTGFFFSAGIIAGMENDFVSLRDAAERVAVSIRQAQRLASRLSESDRQVKEHGATWVRWEAFRELFAHRVVKDDMGKSRRDGVAGKAEAVATLEAALVAAQAEIERQASEIVEMKEERSRHLDIMLAQAQALQHETERQRPLLLGQAPEETPESAPGRWWTRLWGRGR